MTDISKEAVEEACRLLDLDAQENGHKKHIYCDTLRALSARITELEAQQAVDWENINIKADAIDGWINTSAGQYEALSNARDDALQEAADVCDAEKSGYMDHSLPQCAQGAIECRKSILALRTTPDPVSDKARIVDLSRVALKAFTVVEWVVGEGFVLKAPHVDADDLLLEMVSVLGVDCSDAARAALSTKETT